MRPSLNLNMDGAPLPTDLTQTINSKNQDVNLRYSIWALLKANRDNWMSVESIISHFNANSSEFLSWNIRCILLTLLRNNFIEVSSSLKIKPKTPQVTSEKKYEEALARELEMASGQDTNKTIKPPAKSPLAY